MKKTLAFASLITVVLLTSCAHQILTAGIGTGFRAGGPEYGVKYGEGFFATLVTRDAVRFKAEIDSTNGFSYDPVTNSYKGIRSIEYSVGPQANGYAVDFAKENPEVAKAYYDALIKYYETESKTIVPPLISDDKSKAATLSVSEVIKAAIAKAKDIVDDYIDSDEGRKEENQFVCDGNCDYADLTKNPDIAYQLSIAMKLLQYEGDTHVMPDTEERYRATLEHFISEVVAYQARGHKKTPLRVKYVTVENKVIVKLMYAYVKRDGTSNDITCPSCVFMDDQDAD